MDEQLAAAEAKIARLETRMEQLLDAVNTFGYRVEPAQHCYVSPAVFSQWRNGPHWHVVWPEKRGGGSWCYETLDAAYDRLREVVWLAIVEGADEPLDKATR